MSTPKSHHSKVPNITSYIFIGLGQVGNFTDGSSWVGSGQHKVLGQRILGSGQVQVKIRSKYGQNTVKIVEVQV